MTKNKAILLFSGGLDSTTILYHLKKLDYQIYALSFNYGQRQAIELVAAQKIIKAVGDTVREHRIINIDLTAFGGSALTDNNLNVPSWNENVPQADSAVAHNQEQKKNIPITYVPARNTIFLSFALAYAEVKQIAEIFIGVNSMDYSGYPDCRPEYIRKFNELATLATAGTLDLGHDGKQKESIHPSIEVITPLQYLTKAEIIKLGIESSADYSSTSSCYNPNAVGYACGICDACHLRKAGFQGNGMMDPIAYQQ